MAMRASEPANATPDEERAAVTGQEAQESHNAPTLVETIPKAVERPGALRGQSVMTVKTHLAQQLVFGRPTSSRADGKRAIIGLIGFAGMLKPIFTAAKLDDPYADHWLLEIEAAIEAAAVELGELRDGVEQVLARRPDIQHTVAQSVKPVEVPLYFSNQLAFRAAYLVNDFDMLVCVTQTARHVAAITTTKSNALIQRGSKMIRRTFTSASGYRYTGVSRADIAHGTARAGEALARWGALPQAILAGTRRAEYGPPLPADSYARHFAAHPEEPADEGEATG